MPTFAELIERGNATPEQLRDALKRQHERQERTRLNKLQESSRSGGRGTKKESRGDLFTMRMVKAHRDNLRRLSGRMGISQADVMRMAFAEFFERHS